MHSNKDPSCCDLNSSSRMIVKVFMMFRLDVRTVLGVKKNARTHFHVMSRELA